MKFLRAAATCFLLACSPLTAANADLPYDEHADARTAMQSALATAQAERKQVLAIFGANWCSSCRHLDRAIRRGETRIDTSKFVIVKIDVGHFDKNLDLAKAYDVPIRKGIPSAAVFDENRRVIYRGSLSRYLAPAAFRYPRLIVATAVALLVLVALLYRRRKSATKTVADL